MPTATDTPLWTFHLPGRHDQHSHAGGVGGDEALAAAPLRLIDNKVDSIPAAAKPTTVSGPTLDELDEAADAMAALVAKYVGRVAGYAARWLGGVSTTASGLHTFHLPGQHDQASHGRGGDYHATYGDVIDEASAGADGEFVVAYTETSDMHIAFDDPEGSGSVADREVLAEIGPDGARDLAHELRWAADYDHSSDIPDAEGIVDSTGVAGAGHLEVWVHHSGDVGIRNVEAEGMPGWDLSNEEATGFADALDEMAGSYDDYFSGNQPISAAALAHFALTAQAAAPASRQAAVSADDIGMITDQWAVVVGQVLAPAVAADYVAGWQAQQARIAAILQTANLTEEQLAQFQLPLIDVQEAAQQAAADAANRLIGIGDQLWGHARESLTEGMAKGESVPKLAERVRQATGVSVPRATVIARTESMNARNAGAYDEMTTVARLGIVDSKQWLATSDARTRPTHVAADGQTVPFDAKFTVGGWPADRPHDPALPAEEAANCRCTLLFGLSGEEPVYPLVSTLHVFHLPGKHDQASHAGGRGIRTSLADAKSIGEINAVIAGEAKRITGRDVHVDMAGSDPQIAREHGEGVLRCFERYPNARVGEIVTYGPGGAIAGDPKLSNSIAYQLAAAHFYETGDMRSTIAFNVRYASDPARYYREGTSSRFSPRNTSGPLGTATHEFGHSMSVSPDVRRRSQAAVRERARSSGKTSSELVRDSIGTYATTNGHELTAEAFADVMINGAGASATSRDVFAVMDTHYQTFYGAKA